MDMEAAVTQDGRASRKRVLLIEDEYLIANEMARVLAARGMEVIGPAGTVDRAMALIKAGGRIDGAVLDVNLRGEMVFGVAEVLNQLGVPFVFATGYNDTAVPDQFSAVPRCEKPAEPARILQTLFGHANAVPR